jgi:hypothetical protein
MMVPYKEFVSLLMNSIPIQLAVTTAVKQCISARHHVSGVF